MTPVERGASIVCPDVGREEEDEEEEEEVGRGRGGGRERNRGEEGTFRVLSSDLTDTPTSCVSCSRAVRMRWLRASAPNNRTTWSP